MSLKQLATATLVLGISVLTTTPAVAGDKEKGKALYQNLCMTCHGMNGLGDGPVAASLPPEMKPTNLQTGKYKFATNDAKMKELLKKGGAGVGLSALMAGAPGASDADLDNLIAYLNSIRK